jgi:4-amino-4-deoxy-L-arabinose transferase-like glycosyltransferase
MASPTKAQALGCLTVLFILKLIVAAMVPLVPDEAYYTLWSRDLAAGYLDHPPMIAVFIRAGTSLLGETDLGVRLLPVLCGIPTSWFVWKSAESLVQDERAGALAAVLFNATLFGFFGLVLATPDAPVTLFSAAMVYAAARLVADPSPRLWLLLGTATGLGLESKYSAALLALAIGVAVLFCARLRPELKSPWPWLGAFLTVLIWLPNWLWNANHGWATFAKQGGRIVENWTLSPGFVPELLLGQIGLATPLIFLFAVAGLSADASALYRLRDGRRLLLTALLLPVAYFSFHALRGRVEGNWPGFLYPLLAVAAAAGLLGLPSLWGVDLRPLRKAALPLAFACIGLIGLQACLLPIAALGRTDPILRMTRGWDQMASDVERLRAQSGSTLILTDSYPVNAELARFIKATPVKQWNDRQRPGSIADHDATFPGSALYLGTVGEAPGLLKSFATVTPIGTITRSFNHIPLAAFTAYRVTSLTPRN